MLLVPVRYRFLERPSLARLGERLVQGRVLPKRRSTVQDLLPDLRPVNAPRRGDAQTLRFGMTGKDLPHGVDLWPSDPELTCRVPPIVATERLARGLDDDVGVGPRTV